MATFIELDSSLRDREIYASPAEFKVKAEQLIGWFQFARTVRAVPQNVASRPYEFVTSVNLKSLMTPYDAEHLDISRLYVNLESESKKDLRLISSINGVNADAKFALVQEKVQNGSAGTGKWIHWKSLGEQVMRFSRDSCINFRVFTKDGKTLGITDATVPTALNPAKQVIAFFEITPYVREGDYSPTGNLLDTRV